MSDTIRQALERLLAVIKPKYTDPDEIVAVVRAMAAARTALAAEPPAPAEPSDFQTLQGIALDMVESLRPIVLPEILGVLRRAIKQAPAPAPAADGEHEELAQWLEDEAVYYEGLSTEASAKATRAAALLREARPQPVPVPVAERPWERPGWCDAEGRCWWFNRTGIPEWQLADGGPYGDVCLPHWAIPVPANPTETTTTGDQ